MGKRFSKQLKAVGLEEEGGAHEIAEVGDNIPVANKGMFGFTVAIGLSSYGMVWKAKMKKNGMMYSIKIMDKAMVFNNRGVDCILNELELMRVLRFPFLVNLHYAF